MERIQIPDTDVSLSRLMFGCMLLGGKWNREPASSEDFRAAHKAIETALEVGINAFDHADIYCMGKSETLFASVMEAMPGLRDTLFIQSKCGIRFANDPVAGMPKRFDFSAEHIVQSAEGILQRLAIEQLDMLLLHRPDVLMEPEEVAAAFDALESSGKVRFFGVSNHSPSQMDLLRRWVRQPLRVNQIQMSLHYPVQIDSGILTTDGKPALGLRAEGALDYCHLHGIIPQAWSPLAKGKLSGRSLSTEDSHLQPLADAVDALAKAYDVSREAIVLAWLTRHPGRIQPVIGTTNPQRIRACAEAFQGTFALTREEWYTLFTLARGNPLP